MGVCIESQLLYLEGPLVCAGDVAALCGNGYVCSTHIGVVCIFDIVVCGGELVAVVLDRYGRLDASAAVGVGSVGDSHLDIRVAKIQLFNSECPREGALGVAALCGDCYVCSTHIGVVGEGYIVVIGRQLDSCIFYRYRGLYASAAVGVGSIGDSDFEVCACEISLLYREGLYSAAGDVVQADDADRSRACVYVVIILNVEINAFFQLRCTELHRDSGSRSRGVVNKAGGGKGYLAFAEVYDICLNEIYTRSLGIAFGFCFGNAVDREAFLGNVAGNIDPVFQLFVVVIIIRPFVGEAKGIFSDRCDAL